jgi:hypothetical protein
MARSILKTLQNVTAELGFAQPTSVLSSSNGTTVQLLALLTAACDELLDEYDWQFLIKPYTFTTTVGVTSYPLPTDFHRMIPITQWNQTMHWNVAGNTHPQAWGQLQNTAVQGNWAHRMRIVGNKIEVYPSPSTGEVFAFQYITKNYIIDGSLGTLKQEFTLDADLTVFHDRLLANFIKLKLLQVKGFDTRAAVEDFNSSLEFAKGSDTPAPLLTMDRAGQQILPGEEHLLYDSKVL